LKGLGEGNLEKYFEGTGGRVKSEDVATKHTKKDEPQRNSFLHQLTIMEYSFV
jgi:hypothetical protein